MMKLPFSRYSFALTAVVAAAVALGSIRAQAQATKGAAQSAYPAKTVRIIVGYAPGGATDIVGRLIAQKLSEATGQSFIVENRPGASATIAAELVARAAPDGYTLFIAASASHSIMPSLMPKLAYDIHRDFAPVSLVALSPQLMVVHPSLPVRSVADMIKVARAQPGQLNFGSGGTGTPPHLAGEMFQQMAGVRLTHVPYKGEAPALTDLIGGQLALMFSNVVAVLPQVQAGRLRGIAATSATRVPTLPQYPTIGEYGLPGYATDSWFGLVSVAGTPAEVIGRLNAESVRGLNQTDVRERLAAQGLFVKSSTPSELTALMQREVERWSKVIKTAGIKIE